MKQARPRRCSWKSKLGRKDSSLLRDLRNRGDWWGQVWKYSLGSLDEWMVGLMIQRSKLKRKKQKISTVVKNANLIINFKYQFNTCISSKRWKQDHSINAYMLLTSIAFYIPHCCFWCQWIVPVLGKLSFKDTCWVLSNSITSGDANHLFNAQSCKTV